MDSDEEEGEAAEQQLAMVRRNLGGGTVHTDSNLVQRGLNVIGHIESPVVKPQPKEHGFHQLVVITLPKQVLQDPPNRMFVLKSHHAAAAAYHSLFLMLSRITRRASYTASTSNNNRRRGGNMGEPLMDHRMHNSGLYRVYPYMEVLPTADSQPDQWALGGLRFWFFLMDPQKDVGKLFTEVIRANNPEQQQSYTEDIPDQVETYLTKVVSYYLQEDLDHLDQSARHLLADLSSDASFGGDHIDDSSNRFHPSKFFSVKMAMDLHTQGLHPSCKTLSNYMEGSRFREFPHPELVSYVPCHQFCDPRVLFDIPLQNSFFQDQTRQQEQQLRSLRVNAYAQQEMKDGYDELSLSMVHENAAMLLDERQRNTRKQILMKMEKLDQACFSPLRLEKELFNLPVTSNAWPIYKRSDILQLRLHQTGVLRWMSNSIPVSHPEYHAWETLRQKKCLGEFERILREGTVPGPWLEMRNWYFSLDPRQQLFSIDHNRPYLSSYGNFKAWAYWAIENVLKIHTNHNPMYFLYLVSCAVGEFSLEIKGMHTHVECTGNPGSGKSVLFQGLAIIAAPGIVKSYSHQTNLAFTTDDDNITNTLLIYHDAPSFLRGDSRKRGSGMGGHDGTESHNAPMMTGMSEGIITTLEFNQDREKGDPRSNINATAGFQSSVVVGNNESVEGAMEDRVSTMPIASKHRWDKSMIDTGEEGFEFTQEKPVQNEFIHQLRVLCFLCFLMMKAEEAKQVPPVNMSAFEQFKKDLQREITRRFGKQDDSRPFKRMRNVVKAATQCTAFFKNLLSEPAEYTWRRDKSTGKWRPFDFNCIPYVARDCVATSEIILDVFTLMREEFLPGRGYAIAKAILTGFDAKKPEESGSYGKLFIGEDGKVDPDYFAIQWSDKQTPRLLDKELGESIGPKNVEREVARMRKRTLNVHPMMFSDPSAGEGPLVENKHLPKRNVPFACMRSGKMSPNAKTNRKYLCVHVSALQMDMEKETKDIIRSVFEYNGLPPEGQTVVTSFPEHREKVRIQGRDGNPMEVDVTMYHLFQTMHLQHNNRELRIENPNTYSAADMAHIHAVRRHLEETTKFRANRKLDKIRFESVFKETDNVDMRAMVEHWEKLGVKISEYSGLVYPARFSQYVKHYRSKDRERYPEELEVKDHQQPVQECITKIKNLNGGGSASSTVMSLTDVLQNMEEDQNSTYIADRRRIMQDLKDRGPIRIARGRSPRHEEY